MDGLWRFSGDVFVPEDVHALIACVCRMILFFLFFILFYSLFNLSESESECKCLTCNQKPTGSQFSLLHEPN